MLNEWVVSEYLKPHVFVYDEDEVFMVPVKDGDKNYMLVVDSTVLGIIMRIVYRGKRVKREALARYADILEIKEAVYVDGRIVLYTSGKTRLLPLTYPGDNRIFILYPTKAPPTFRQVTIYASAIARAAAECMNATCDRLTALFFLSRALVEIHETDTPTFEQMLSMLEERRENVKRAVRGLVEKGLLAGYKNYVINIASREREKVEHGVRILAAFDRANMVRETVEKLVKSAGREIELVYNHWRGTGMRVRVVRGDSMYKEKYIPPITVSVNGDVALVNNIVAGGRVTIEGDKGAASTGDARRGFVRSAKRIVIEAGRSTRITITGVHDDDDVYYFKLGDYIIVKSAKVSVEPGTGDSVVLYESVFADEGESTAYEFFNDDYNMYSIVDIDNERSNIDDILYSAIEQLLRDELDLYESKYFNSIPYIVTLGIEEGLIGADESEWRTFAQKASYIVEVLEEILELKDYTSDNEKALPPSTESTQTRAG